MSSVIRAALDLKGVRRQGWIEKADMDESESVADHSYATCVIAMVLADEGGLDTERVMRMVLLHDMAESITGDITPDAMPHNEKRRREQKAMDDILGELPAPLRRRYRGIWDEYAAQNSPESRLAHDADRIDMALQAHRYADSMSPEALEMFVKSGADQGRLSHILDKLSA